MGYVKAGKRVTVVLTCLVVLMQMIGESSGRYIEYGPMKGDEIPGCGPKHPEMCREQQANPYNRGCSPLERCREGTNEEYFDDEMVEHPIQQAPAPAPAPAGDDQTTTTSTTSNSKKSSGTFINYNRHEPIPSSIH